MDRQTIIAILGFLAGIFAALIGVFTKYVFDYRISKRKLLLEEQSSISTVLGPSQANFIRATVNLYTRLNNFFEDPSRARKWLKPSQEIEKDGYYLREFIRRMFNFIAWGRITQDAINSLPAILTKERPDLQRTYVFIELANSLLTYTWLFRGTEEYEDQREKLHIFTGTLDAIAEYGVQIWKEGDQRISRIDFEKAYQVSGSPLTALRDMLAQLEDENSDATGFIIARLAALRAILAGFLKDYSWTIEIPDKPAILRDFKQHLEYASTVNGMEQPFPKLVPRNLKELMDRYKCKLLEF